MGRYRPPQATSTPYITRHGYEVLEDELKGLWSKRDEVTKALSAAAAEGDRSENAEYIYRKKQLREIDRRIRYLQKRLPALKVVDQAPQQQEQVFFGAWVTLENEQGEETTYRIVGPDEFDMEPAYISLDSPMARAMLKKRLYDEIQVITPKGQHHYTIIGIRYAQAGA